MRRYAPLRDAKRCRVRNDEDHDNGDDDDNDDDEEEEEEDNESATCSGTRNHGVHVSGEEFAARDGNGYRLSKVSAAGEKMSSVKVIENPEVPGKSSVIPGTIPLPRRDTDLSRPLRNSVSVMTVVPEKK